MGRLVIPVGGAIGGGSHTSNGWLGVYPTPEAIANAVQGTMAIIREMRY